MTVGERIRQIRKAAGLTQNQLAKKMNISYVNISQLENGREPKMDTLVRVASALGCRVEDLVGLETFDTGEEFEKRRKELLEELDKNGSEGVSAAYGPGGAITSIEVTHTEPRKTRLNAAYDSMNAVGQQKAVTAVEDLAKVPEYQDQPAAPAAVSTSPDETTPQK